MVLTTPRTFNVNAEVWGEGGETGGVSSVRSADLAVRRAAQLLCRCTRKTAFSQCGKGKGIRQFGHFNNRVLSLSAEKITER